MTPPPRAGPRHGLDAGAEDLGHVRAVVEAEGNDPGGDGRQHDPDLRAAPGRRSRSGRCSGVPRTKDTYSAGNAAEVWVAREPPHRTDERQERREEDRDDRDQDRQARPAEDERPPEADELGVDVARGIQARPARSRSGPARWRLTSGGTRARDLRLAGLDLGED